MGKYQNSEIHDKYSDFHYYLLRISEKYKVLYVTDIDRLWVEVDFNRTPPIIGVFDIKFDYGIDSVSATEKKCYNWFNSVSVPVYIVFMSDTHIEDKHYWKFRVEKWPESNTVFEGHAIGYADWLLSLRYI